MSPGVLGFLVFIGMVMIIGIPVGCGGGGCGGGGCGGGGCGGGC